MIRLLLPLLLLLAACASAPEPQVTRAATATHTLYPGETPEVRKLVNKWADHYAIPRSLLHRVIQRESDYRPGARNGPYWGMMQILPATARNMGMRGDPAQLLDADTALKYSARYLRGAWMVSDGDEKAAMMWYARGFYYEAKKRGLLRATGLRGELWQSYDQGAAKMPAIGPRGRLLPEAPAAPECTRASGLAGLVGGRTCS